ncbi:MAG TPA: hypothetical protein VK572_12690 [Burkholderiales bacterium]|nr:hypothetical protein [Burkholderiales bacterium]
MSTREELEAALAEAEAELARAVAGRAAAAVDVAEAKLERARAHCRHARTALAEMNRAEPAARSVGRTEKSNRSAEQPSKEYTGPRRSVLGFLSAFSARLPAKNAPSRQLIARQGLMLLALVLAYLQYYFLDVNLKVSLLPSITVLVFG